MKNENQIIDTMKHIIAFENSPKRHTLDSNNPNFHIGMRTRGLVHTEMQSQHPAIIQIQQAKRQLQIDLMLPRNRERAHIRFGDAVASAVK